MYAKTQRKNLAVDIPVLAVDIPVPAGVLERTPQPLSSTSGLDRAIAAPSPLPETLPSTPTTAQVVTWLCDLNPRHVSPADATTVLPSPKTILDEMSGADVDKWFATSTNMANDVMFLHDIVLRADSPVFTPVSSFPAFPAVKHCDQRPPIRGSDCFLGEHSPHSGLARAAARSTAAFNPSDETLDLPLMSMGLTPRFTPRAPFSPGNHFFPGTWLLAPIGAAPRSPPPPPATSPPHGELFAGPLTTPATTFGKRSADPTGAPKPKRKK